MTYHTPYENWIFQHDELTMEQRLKLYEHLESCESCSQLEKAWRGTEGLFKNSAMIDAPVGFAMRWRESIQPRFELHQRNQAFKAFIGFSSALFICLVILGFQFLRYGSPVDWIFITLQNTARFMVYSAQVLSFAIGVMKAVPPALSVSIGFLVFAASGIAILFWAYWFWQVSRKRSSLK